VRNIFKCVTELVKQNAQRNKRIKKADYISLILLFLSFFCTSYSLLHEIYDSLHSKFRNKNFNEYLSETS